MQPAKPHAVSAPISFSAPISADTTRPINGTLTGRGTKAIILSNMDTNCQKEWQPLVATFAANNYMILRYDYLQLGDDQTPLLEAAIRFLRSQGAEQIILLGASRGGVSSIKVAANPDKDQSLVGVVAISAPIEYEGTTFYSTAELAGINIPKLLINSADDDCAADTRRMYQLLSAPKVLKIYSGDAHGTEIFQHHRSELVQLLSDFCRTVFAD